jgi:hypothetical protein
MGVHAGRGRPERAETGPVAQLTGRSTAPE